jgi:ribosomal protein L37AE/L43A
MQGISMEDNKTTITWAPRVRQRPIRRLYELDARGIYDEELLDKVGWGLYARCESFIAAVEAVNGSVHCPSCGQVIFHNHTPEEILQCKHCGWEMTWRAYFKTIQHKQLSGAEPVIVLFKEYIEKFTSARTPQEKMLLIDCLIHGFHWNMVYGPTRATGVNLIEGNYHEVVDFLDNLTYGESSTPGTRAVWQEWREKINETASAWGDERLKRPD